MDPQSEPQDNTAQAPAATPASNAQTARRAGRRSRAQAVVLAALLLALGFAGWAWYETRVRLGGTQEEFARLLRGFETESREARATAREAQDAVREAQAKIAQLDARLTEAQVEQIALETLYQELARSRDEWQLAEVEQLLAIAAQQLQLSGNVRSAMMALQLAESRLARADRPQFLAVRRALARDIERLKALPALDIAGISLRLDRLVAAVDRLPLANEERLGRVRDPKPVSDAAATALEIGFWQRLGGEIWDEVKSLIVVRRIDVTEPPLLAPSQAYFLRENLRLRLLNARLSLLTRDESGYREQVRAAQAWVGRYFDPRSKQTTEALGQLKELAAVPLGWDLPGIAESLEAARNFKARRASP